MAANASASQPSATKKARLGQLDESIDEAPNNGPRRSAAATAMLERSQRIFSQSMETQARRGVGKTCSSRPIEASETEGSYGLRSSFDPMLLHPPVRNTHPLDADIETSLDAAHAGRKRGCDHTGVKRWFHFCENIMQTPAARPLDPNEPLWAKLEEEWLCMRFVTWLVQETGVAPDTAAGYFSAVQGWHLTEYGVKLVAGLKLEKLPRMLKGLRRRHDPAPRMIRRGISPEMLRAAMDARLDPKVPSHANLRAALAVALQGLLRSAEYCGKPSKETLLRSDIKKLNSEQLVIMMHPCKNMKHLSGKTCALVIGAGGELIDAVAEMRNLVKVDPASAGSPLFRDPLSNLPLSYKTVLNVTRELMSVIGENPDQFGTHSYRIGGATALFAAGATDTIIRTMGRWSSDMHRLYVRACMDQCLDWTRRAGSTRSRTVAAEFDEVDDY